MMNRTRNFVIASLVVLCAGVGTGLVAYYGFPTSALAPAGGPDELKFLPSSATLVAYADVHEVMTSELRQKLRTAMPLQGDGQRSFQSETGINIETDIDQVAFGLTPVSASPGGRSDGLVIARGRFDEVRIEASMRDHGARVEDYKGSRVITAEPPSIPAPAPAPDAPPQPPGPARRSLSLAFIEPGLLAVGSPVLVRHAVDLKSGGDSVLVNDEIMGRIKALERGNVWAVGRFDALTERANLVQGMVSQLPAITWFSASGQVDSGISTVLKAETRDEESANGLRDVIRGFVALARMQAGSRPELQPLLQSIQLGGEKQTVTLSLDVSPQTLDLLPRTVRPPARPRP
jgi:hypothetical protein